MIRSELTIQLPPATLKDDGTLVSRSYPLQIMARSGAVRVEVDDIYISPSFGVLEIEMSGAGVYNRRHTIGAQQTVLPQARADEMNPMIINLTNLNPDAPVQVVIVLVTVEWVSRGGGDPWGGGVRFQGLQPLGTDGLPETDVDLIDVAGTDVVRAEGPYYTAALTRNGPVLFRNIRDVTGQVRILAASGTGVIPVGMPGGTTVIIVKKDGVVLESSATSLDFRNIFELGTDGAGNVIITGLSTGSVGTGLLADGAVTNAKLATESVTEAKIGPAAVAEAKLADGAVTSAKLAANAVTFPKMETDAVRLIGESVGGSPQAVFPPIGGKLAYIYPSMGMSAATTAPAANSTQTYYYPINIPAQCSIGALGVWGSTTSTGNVRVSLFDTRNLGWDQIVEQEFTLNANDVGQFAPYLATPVYVEAGTYWVGLKTSANTALRAMSNVGLVTLRSVSAISDAVVSGVVETGTSYTGLWHRPYSAGTWITTNVAYLVLLDTTTYDEPGAIWP